MASQWQAQAMVRQHIDEATCHKRNREAARRYNESTAIRARLGSTTTQGVSTPVPRAGFDWSVARASDAFKREVATELGCLQALERHIRQVNQHFSQPASISHDSRVDNKQSSLQQPLLSPRKQISIQAGEVVSPPNHRALATARTNLRQSFNQPSQSYAHDILSNLHQSPAHGTQINAHSAPQTRDKPSNQPQSQTNLDQSQTYEPRIPLRPTFSPPSAHFSPQEIRGETQTPRRQFEKKVESEEQTSKRGDSIDRAGFERFQGVNNAIQTLSTVAETVELRQHDRSSLKHTRSPSNDCGSAQTQVVDCGGEARLLQAAASMPLEKKVRWGLPQDHSLGTSADVQVEVADDWKLLPGEAQPTPPESGQRPNMSHSRVMRSLDVEIENDIDKDDDGALDDELLCSSPVPITKQPKLQPKAPASPDILRTQQRQSPQAPPVSQDTSRTQQRQSPQAPSASQDTSRAQLSQSPQVSSASQDTSHARLSQSSRVSSAAQDTSHARLSQSSQVSSASQDTPHAQLSQSSQVSSAAQDTSHARLSQIQRGLIALTSGDREDGAPPQPLQSPLVSDSSAPLPWSSSPVRRVDVRHPGAAFALDSDDELMLHAKIYGECAMNLDAEKYDFSAIVVPFVPSPAGTNAEDEGLVSATPRAVAADVTLELEAGTGSTSPPDINPLSPEEQRWLDGAARSTPRKLAANDIVLASHKCRMYLANHPQTKARAKHYVWALFTMLRYDLPTVKELGDADFDPALIDRILTELGDFNAFWLPASGAFHTSSRAFRIAEGVAGPHPDNQGQIDDTTSTLHQGYLCQCGKAHHPWQTVIHILRIGCGLFETFEADNQISHLTGVACIAKPNAIVMESGMDNRTRVRCHEGDANGCQHTPPCRFISNPYEHVLQTTIELRTRLSQSLTNKVTHYCSPCNKTITGSTRDWVVHVSEHSQSVFMENSDEYAVLCPSGRNLDKLAASTKGQHLTGHRKGRCADINTWADKTLDHLPPGLRSAHVGHFWRAFKALEVDPKKLRTQILRLDYKYKSRNPKARATGIQEEQAGEDE
ncbi:hypothetical protein LTR56_001612 [Elasticomyces elasticus]|nr:hypothetical protein LTR56_001612 [Elasticomyces elasticus]KAK4932584.1 hypothetical protein LTR49_001008 [Elasticomyces elasticus]KAK5769606.1 hypothetical protein LTS12_000056 [Elasticomyces elasticus]